MSNKKLLSIIVFSILFGVGIVKEFGFSPIVILLVLLIATVAFYRNKDD